MTKTYIVAAKRTAIGKFLGTTLSMTAADLGAAVIKNIIAETGVNPANIDEVIVGNVLSAGQGQGVARQASIKGGFCGKLVDHILLLQELLCDQRAYEEGLDIQLMHDTH